MIRFITSHIKYTLVTALLLCLYTGSAQVFLNEASSRNYSQAFDEDGESKDWFEIFNASQEKVHMADWTVSDDSLVHDRWIFPTVDIDPGGHLLIFASGKGTHSPVEKEYWQSPVLPGDTFRYLIPESGTSADWKTPGFDDSSWLGGSAGFGYGDDDDNSLVGDGTAVIYIRKSFTIDDTLAIAEALCHIDYDDGFVAYLNGVELCRRNISGDPAWDSYANSLREALMFQGGMPEKFVIEKELLSSTLIQGENVFAVEVHNVSSESSDLSLIPFLSFRIVDGGTYFPDSPGWVSSTLGSDLHTNFKLDPMGETLYLYDSVGRFVDSLQVSRTLLDYSIGRQKDGAETIAVFKKATPGSTNNTSEAYVNGYEPYPLVFPAAGFYIDSLEVSLSTFSSTAVIRYTLDGSEPTSSSTLYTGPIKIVESSVLNARCFSKTNKLDGLTVTSTYFVDDDYTIPVLSVTTDAANLYGGNGIFTNWQQSWNKPCYFEYFENRKLVLRQEAGMQIDGGAGGSRSKPQHSFRIEPDHGSFGEGSISYKLIPDRPERKKYASFYIRNGSNQYLILPYKDAVETRGMGKGTYNYYSSYRPVAVHINGKFFGIYEMREKLNEDYLVNNYGMNIDSLDLLGVSYFKGMWLQPQVGLVENYMADYEYFLTLDPESPDYIEKVGEFLDLNNYTDYIIGQTWIANTDWPQNNIKVFRCASTDYKWRFVLVDLEWALKPNEWAASGFDHINYMNEKAEENLYIIFWYRMMQTEEYRYRFLNRFADLMNTNYSFDVLGQIENDMYNELLPEMSKQYARWGSSNIESQMSTFMNNHTTFRSELSKRSSMVYSHLRKHYDIAKNIYVDLDVYPAEAGKLKVNTIIPGEYPWRGIYFDSIPITIKAIPRPGYVFSEWEENPDIPDLSEAEFTVPLQSSYNDFVAKFVPGSIDFDGICISEINYKSNEDIPTTDWFEIYNGTDLPLDLTAHYFTDKDTSHRYSFPEGTIIPSEGRLVVAMDTLIFRYLHPDVKNYTGGFQFGFNEFDDIIRIYKEDGSELCSVHYLNAYPWPLENIVDGRTLEILDPNGDPNDPENWFAGCPGGSPGRAWEKCGLAASKDEYFSNSLHVIHPGVKAYPNPVEHELTLELFLPAAENDLQLRIYSMAGTLVVRKSFPSIPSGVSELTVNLEQVSGYQILFVVVSGDTWKESLKVIKRD